MAKKENQVDVFGGLSFGTKVGDNNNKETEDNAEPKVETITPIGPQNEPNTELKQRKTDLDAKVPAEAEIGAEKKKTPKIKPIDVRSQLVADYQQAVYQRQKKETLTARIQIATTPTIKAKLKELELNGEIKSMNHLINSLLCKYLGIDED